MSRLERQTMTRHRPNNSGGSISSSDGSSFEGHTYGEDRSASAANRRMNRKNSEPNSPLSARLPLRTDRGYFDASPMAKTESNDSYRMPWSSRKSEDDSGDNDADEAFTCGLAYDFDRMRREIDEYASNDASMTPQKRQRWLDSHFDRLSMKHRAQPPSKKGDRDGTDRAKTAKPHFLDLSSIIAPVPLDITTPPAAQLNCEVGLDSATPRPSFAQRFASVDNVHTMPVPKIASTSSRQPLQPSFAANVVAVGSASSGPTKWSLRVKASQDSLRTAAISPTTSTFPRPGLRSRCSFENPSEVRRRQQDDWDIQNVFFDQQSSGVPQLPDWARHQNRANNIPATHAKKPSEPFIDDQTIASAVPLGLRSSPMSRGVSHDTAMANPPTPTRPRLATRAPSSALRHRMDRSTAYPADMYSPISPSFPPPSLSSSRGSCGSSNDGSDSMPPTPSSATFVRSLANITPPKALTQRGGYASPQEKEYMQTMMAHHASSHGRSPSASGSDDADAVAWSQNRAAHNLTPRAAKVSHRPPLAYHSSCAPEDHALLSPPRSSSLRRCLSEAAGEDAAASTANTPTTAAVAAVASDLPYAQDRRKQQHASWDPESHYSIEDDAGSAYVSAIEQQPSLSIKDNIAAVAPVERAVTPTGMHKVSGTTSSKWSLPTLVSQSTMMQGRSRANSRAEEWASSIGRRFAKGVNAKMA